MPWVHRTPVDPLARALQVGLVIVLVAAPLPWGAVGPESRRLFEGSSLLLGLIWGIRGLFHANTLPPVAARLGLIGLLALGALQLAPLPSSLVDRISSRSAEIHRTAEPPEAIRRVEARLLGRAPAPDGPPIGLSVDPAATASALRTGAALVALLFVACTAVSVCGGRIVAITLLGSAAFQGLYGLMMMAAAEPRIWHLPKQYALDSATGTFVNPNHFACFLAMALPGGLVLILAGEARRSALPWRQQLARWFDAAGARRLLMAALFLCGLAGLLTSYSRAGIAVAVLALWSVALAPALRQHARTRVFVASALILVATLPLIRVGPERLAERYADAETHLFAPGGRAQVWRDTARIVQAFPLVGSGFGSFAVVYPVFRSAEVRSFYAHAHQDLLQHAAEGGCAGTVLLLLILWPLGHAMVRAFLAAGDPMGIGFAAGLLAMLLHALVDFNFHIPANAATAVVLAGSLWGLTGRGSA